MREWLARGCDGTPDITVLGAPISKASISASQAWSTPAAFRDALARLPTWHAGASADVEELAVRDAGDVGGDQHDPDASAAHARIEEAVATLAATGTPVVVIGGDNSLTRPAFLGMTRARPDRRWGLLTLDAHHDCRPVVDRSANGTPVRELIEAGLPGERVAQVGIHPLGNAREHAAWALGQGIHVHDVADVRARGVEVVVAAALAQLRECGANAIYVDLDIDVVDRAFAPACPASLPGGLAPRDLLDAALLVGGEPDVAAVDLCEVDALADVAGITMRLLAASFTSLCAGLVARRRATAR
ncbi:MAG TPA: arginase family protein [Candidatus Dormibacteraeota bacterium]|jgi:formiminoglutamase|nr:arginase family protein [Candidatus Dormibacteraeota bacterium]